MGRYGEELDSAGSRTDRLAEYDPENAANLALARLFSSD
jgi:hypothetical protein